MIIQHNLPSMNSHRQLGLNNSFTIKNLEKLSSGLKINRAADDAAGLAISEKMRGQIRGLVMAEQNAANGINLIQTAEGGLNEIHSILQRMRELAVQSSNGTYQDEDRGQLELEFTALKEEIDRISEYTHYNDIKLLDGSLSKIGTASIPGAPGTPESFMPTPPPTATVISGGVITGTITQDTVITGNVTINGNVTVADGVNLYIMKDAVVDFASSTSILNEGTIHNNGTVMERRIYNGTLDGSINGLVINYSDGYINEVTNTKGSLFVNYGHIEIAVNNNDICFNWGNIGSISNMGTFTNYGHINTVAYNRSNCIVECYGTIGAVGNNRGSIEYLDMPLFQNTGLVLQIGANGTLDQRVTAYIENMGAGYIGRQTGGGFVSVADCSVRARDRANTAIEVIDGAVNAISAQRADLGALQNRLEHTLNNLGITKENLTASESTIRDADMAKEMIAFTKNNILIQSAQSMLAQSNQLPQGVLSLLR